MRGILAHLTQSRESDAPSNTRARTRRQRQRGAGAGVLENRGESKEELENLQFSNRMREGVVVMLAGQGRAPPSAAAAMLLFSGSGISQSHRPPGSTDLQALKTDAFQRKCCAGATLYASIICHLGSQVAHSLSASGLDIIFLSLSAREMQPEFYRTLPGLHFRLACWEKPDY